MSFPRYPEYKDSGVEWLSEVPAHWEIKKLKHVSPELTVGIVVEPSRLYAEEGVPTLRSLNVKAGAISLANLVFITQAGHALHSKSKLRAGDIVAVRTGQPGTSAVVPQELDGCNCIDLIVIRRPTVGSERFLCWYLGSDPALVQFSVGSGGAIQQHFNISTAAELIVAVPPRTEQNAIAAFLDRETAKIDALVAEQQRLIELLKEKRQAVISHAVTKGLNPDVPMKPSSIEWLGEVPTHWEVRRVSSLSTKITNGYVGPTRDIFVDDGIRYLQSLHIKDNKIRFDVPYFVSEEWSRQHSKSVLEAGDVLIVQTGDIGQAAVVTDEFAGCNCHALIIVSPVRAVVEGAWIALVLKAEFGLHSLLSIQTGALHPHLNCGDVKDVFIPLPPLVEQRQIIEKVSEQICSLDALVLESERAIALLGERRAALISAAVTGQIDVRAIADRAAA